MEDKSEKARAKREEEFKEYQIRQKEKMKTEKVRFEINKYGNLIIYVKDLLRNDKKEIKFAIIKELKGGLKNERKKFC